MRLANTISAAVLGLSALAIDANAIPALPGGTEIGSPAPIIEAAVHCGPHAHYVRGHRNRAGHYVKGRCVRDHR